MKGVFKKWKQWGDVDENGNFWVDNEGVPSKQEDCKEPIQCAVNGVPCKPEWDDWNDWSCQGSCPENSVKKRSRGCRDSDTQTSIPLENCDSLDGEAEETGEKCLNVDFDQPFIEPVTRTELQVGCSHVRPTQNLKLISRVLQIGENF